MFTFNCIFSWSEITQMILRNLSHAMLQQWDSNNLLHTWSNSSISTINNYVGQLALYTNCLFNQYSSVAVISVVAFAFGQHFAYIRFGQDRICVVCVDIGKRN